MILFRSSNCLARLSHSRMRPAFFALCLLGAAGLPARANYRAKAIEATDFIQRAFYDQNAGLYRPAIPVDKKGLPYEVMWGNGVQFSALTGAVKWEPARYRPALDAFTKGLNRYWDKDAPFPGFDAYFASRDNDDKYYDDNQWLVIGFVEANAVTKNQNYLKWAREAHDFSLSGWDEKLGGGVYWHEQDKKSKNTCSNAPAIVSALALYEATGNKSDLEWATKDYNWTCTHLQDADGLFWDNISLEGKVQDWKFTYNTALMIRANLGLWRATKDPKYLAEARRVSDASLQKWVNPQSGAFADDARFNHLLAEAFLQTFEATRDIKYLNAVRRNADFGYRQVRDVRDGGYFNKWNAGNRPDSEHKILIENASVARLFWLLTPYLDTEELRAKAEDAARQGNSKAALGWFDQTLASTAGATPTQVQLPNGASAN
ncbi:Glycosyl hydrolase family 76 [Abditibacterium utsteinense]|uniref:Glycosyl hydrolase family 76 n=1 Tax=Abditibacterium utsteinense TaxID=1960156 RepID=A0A2S8SRV0_9BACT|nr:glycoside hydrolase family 76 protein [Abditibacterium utsteinense]PQV63517.1 Glycosyl hydrolase family 76 [Abditibacterium utsteinense]